MDFVYAVFSVDPFTKKEWYDVKAPSMFEKRNIGKTMVTRTQGTSMCCLSSLYGESFDPDVVEILYLFFRNCR